MRCWLLAFGILCSFGATAQQKTISGSTIEQVIERLFSIQEEDLDRELLAEVFFELYQNPIDLNQASTEELLATYLLSPSQVQAIQAYKLENGRLLSLYELQAIPGFDLATIELLLPFLRTEEEVKKTKPFLTRLLKEENAYLLLRHRQTWEKRQGYANRDTSANLAPGKYLGSPSDFFFKFRIQHPKDFSLGFLLEKDPGEQITWNPKTKQYGADFTSFHFTRYRLGKWKTITLGDYQASFGQGLVFGAGYHFGKGSETITSVRRSSIGLRPYTASLESGFFRGMGLSRQFQRWNTSILLSSSPRDGNLLSTSEGVPGQEAFFTGFSSSGMHRTSSELARKHQLQETSLGWNIQYTPKEDTWALGWNSLYTQFNFPIKKDPNLYNTYDFQGQSNQVHSIYTHYLWKNFNFFGEWAMSKSLGQGRVIGWVSSLHKNVDLSFLWRKYDRDFHSFYSTAFSENSSPINEQGIYLGIQLKPLPHLKINAYFDQFSFPWLKYRVYAPSKGKEMMINLTFQPNKQVVSSLQFRKEQKERNLADEGLPSTPYHLAPITKTNLSAFVEIQALPYLQLRSRMLWNQVQLPSHRTQGWMMVQEATLERNKWQLSGRVALFDAPTYDNRLYAVEKNVWSTFSIPSFFGRGTRKYLLLHYKVSEKVNIYFRWARTSYLDRDRISSGAQAIDGKHQTDTSLVLRVYFN